MTKRVSLFPAVFDDICPIAIHEPSARARIALKIQRLCAAKGTGTSR